MDQSLRLLFRKSGHSPALALGKKGPKSKGWLRVAPQDNKFNDVTV